MGERRAMPTGPLERPFHLAASGAPRKAVSDGRAVIRSRDGAEPIILRFRHGGDIRRQRPTPAEIRAPIPELEGALKKEDTP